jgi:hypothetical protein
MVLIGLANQVDRAVGHDRGEAWQHKCHAADRHVAMAAHARSKEKFDHIEKFNRLDR